MLNFKSEIAKKIAQVVKLETSELETYIEIPKDSTNGDFSFPCFRLAKELKKAPQVIASEIKEKLVETSELETYIEIPKDSTNGDFSFPCFRLAKELKKAPQVIASEIKEKLELEESNDIIEKIDVIGGYLNFYINKNILIKEVLSEINKEKENYGASDIGKGKNIIVEYSSPNIAKEFHIGHLRTTVIGAAFYNIYKYLGYNTIGINHLGDYGTQFGKMIEGYKRWGEEYNLEENPIEELTKMYIRINDLCKSDENVLNACRENFRKLEEGDKECIELWNKFKDLSLKEFYKTYDMLGVKFDSLNGESFYSDKMPEVIEILEKSGKLVESQGARIVDLEDKGINTPCIIEKTNGSTTYATRDLAAILYRARTYDFDKCIYVVAYEQNLHFKQVFEVAKLLGLDKKYTDGLTHIAYGMTRLATGRMSTREGKEFHIGHLRTTVIGAAFYNIYKYLGYNTIGINHLGDYGTQFGKMIEGYKRWGEEYNLEENPIEELTKMYIRINDLCKSAENLLNACRENFRKLEEGDKECIELWNKFKDLSLKEFYKTYDMLGVKFDSLNGESFYSDKMPEVIEILEKTGKLIESQGAKIVDLEDKGINTPCIIEKTNGSTTYATRDLAAILYRARTYDFDKCIYVVAYEQNLHFKQVFEVAKLLGLDKKYTDGLTHIAYGMTRLATGRMSTREGNVVKVNELLEESVKRVLDIINEKTPEMEDKEDNARKIGIGAVIFNNLCTNLIKDQIFDWNIVLNFNGETGPYIQYIYVRTKSVLEKANYMPNLEDVDFSLLEDEKSFYIIKKIYEFNNILKQVIEKNETSILARYLIELAQGYSNFYNDNKIIVEDKKVQDARLYLTYAVGNVLKIGMKLLGIEMPTKM